MFSKNLLVIYVNIKQGIQNLILAIKQIFATNYLPLISSAGNKSNSTRKAEEPKNRSRRQNRSAVKKKKIICTGIFTC